MMQDFRLKQNTSLSKTRLNLNEVLELLLSPCDIRVLTRIFSTIGIYLLSPETNYGSIIKCDPLYDKIVTVLNSGLQEKTTVAINLICALLYINDIGQTKKKSLHIYAQNMIRISGCLTSMTNLFISFMMHRDTLRALCQSISEACRECTSNQTYCSHIVPLCIRRCVGGSSDMFIVLQSLLSSHSRNMKLFHEHNGMKIFTRESLQHQHCLQLLNTVVENTTDENYHAILVESSQLFEHLRYFLYRYGASNSIGQWASIILFSYQKVLRTYDKEKNIVIGESIREYEEEDSHNLRYVVCNDERNDTNELFRNILKEVNKIQRINYNPNKTNRLTNSNINFNEDIHHAVNVIVENKVFKENAEHKINYDILEEPIPTTHNDLSFSFLYKAHPKQTIKNQTRETLSYVPNPIRKKYINNNSLVPCYNQTACNNTRNIAKMLNATLTQDGKDSTFNFAPPFVSTPKSNIKTFKSSFVSQLPSLSITKSAASKRQCNMKTRINKSKNIRTSGIRKLQNKTISAKFIDIINGSCTTLVKSFKSFRNIFRNKEPTCKDISTSTSCADKLTSNSFTSYMHKRDEISNCFYEKGNETSLKRELGSDDDNFGSCNTCNNTIALKQKLMNDTTLQQTVKRLKFGINMFGCDFKKISRTMWPNEHYMTPSVLYNLYRKLIIK